jgi:hypothetical protein
MIIKETDIVEKGLTVICNDVPVNDKTTLDILCHDSNGQLVILQVNMNEDDFMLLQGIQSLDYIEKFKSFLKATYNKHKIDDKENPRLILLAPSFSDAVRRAAESMKGMRIDLYEFEYLKLGDHKGLRLQPVFTWNPAEKPKEEKPTEKKQSPKKKESPPPPQPDENEEPKPEPPTEEFQTFPPMNEEKPKEEKKSWEEPKKKLKLF